MRIAMIGQKGIPAHSGGVEQHVEMLAGRLAHRGHDVLVYCRRSYCTDGQAAVGESRAHGPRRIFRPSIATKHLDAISHTVTSTADAMFRDVDVVHYHAIGPAALAPVARLRGTPVVVTCHGLDWQRAKWGPFAKRCLRLGEWVAARCASELVVVSEPLCEYFAREHHVQARFIPNGVVPIERRSPNRIRQWDLRPGRYLLAVARLVPEKGLHYLIRAFESLDCDLKLVIAGSGGLDASYEQQLRSMAGPRVVFTGGADRELVAELYSNAFLFVLPSDLEGMSIALLEAMSCGLPVVVSDIPENTCVVGSDGFTFRRGDGEHLEAVLAPLVEDNGLLTEFGERCRARAERYEWDHVVLELEEVYHDAITRTARPLGRGSSCDASSAAPSHRASSERLRREPREHEVLPQR